MMTARERQMLQDWRDAADATGHIGICPGGRPMLKDFICIHCGRDTSIPGQTCGQPLNADGTLSKRIPAEVIED